MPLIYILFLHGDEENHIFLERLLRRAEAPFLALFANSDDVHPVLFAKFQFDQVLADPFILYIHLDNVHVAVDFKEVLKGL